MLNKLLKYDLKYMIRNMSIFYVLAFIFAIITRILFSLEQNTIITTFAYISNGFTIAMIANILINVAMRSWVRFRDSLYKDEAYLTHTLPVTKNDIYNSKFIQSLIFFVLSLIVVLICIVIAYYSKERWLLIKEYFNSFANFSGINPVLLVIGLILVLSLEIFNLIQCGFFGLILGHEKNDNQLLFSVIFAFLVYIASQIFVAGISSIVMLIDDSSKVLLILSIIAYSLVILIMNILCKRELNTGVNVE